MPACKNLLQRLGRARPAHTSTTDHVEYEIIEPCHRVTFPIRLFPENIEKPHYAFDGSPNKHTNTRLVKSKEEIQKIWTSCRIAKKILMATGEHVEVRHLWRRYFSILLI